MGHVGGGQGRLVGETWPKILCICLWWVGAICVG